MTLNRGSGIIDTPSSHSVDETVEKLQGMKFCSAACRNRTMVQRHRQRSSPREREARRASARRREQQPKAKRRS